MSFDWLWKDGAGAVMAGITIYVTETFATLSYQLTKQGKASDMRLPITLTRTECTLGGERIWFICPRCYHRVAIIYLGSNPGCRRCLKLTYRSQSEDAVERTWRRTRKIEARLAAGADKWDGWSKPKGMRWTTFERLRGQLRTLEDQRNAAFYTYALRTLPVLVGRLDRLKASP